MSSYVEHLIDDVKSITETCAGTLKSFLRWCSNSKLEPTPILLAEKLATITAEVKGDPEAAVRTGVIMGYLLRVWEEDQKCKK